MTSVIVSNGVTTSTLTTNIFDGKLRRRIRREFAWQSGGWVQTNEVRYFYDGNVAIQERDNNNLGIATYTRGKDLSGSLQGAGGIGGLLARTESQSSINGQPSTSFYHADGNGNVTAMINSLQFIAARYLYDPFGNILSRSGPLASVNMYRFSSKENDLNSGLTYYLRRFYDPNLQRWMSRDPNVETSFDGFDSNDYLFVRNNALFGLDAFGLCYKVISGSPGVITGGLGTIIKHHLPGGPAHGTVDTFTLTCPPGKPYLGTVGLGTSSLFSPDYDDFPNWGLVVNGVSGTFTVVVDVPSRITTTLSRGSLSGLFVEGCCYCKSVGTQIRKDPPAPPPHYNTELD
jgi:RHS repeat-associated protein